LNYLSPFEKKKKKNYVNKSQGLERIHQKHKANEKKKKKKNSVN
jgi:hypothetical protein